MMKIHKLDRMLSLLNGEQLQRLQSFINSPYYNTNQRVVALGMCLTEGYLNPQSQKLDRERLFEKTYPGEPFQDNKLRAMLSIVTRLVEDFLVAEHIRGNQVIKQQMLLQSAQLAEDDRLFKAHLDISYQLQEDSPLRDIDYYFAHHQVEEASYNFAVKKKDKEIGQSLEDLLINLDLYYLSKRLKYSCESLNRRNILGEEALYSGMGLISGLIAHHEPHLPAVALIYRQIIYLFDKDKEVDTNHFYVLIDLLAKHDAFFTRNELKVMYGYAMNYCIRQINSGQSVFLQEVFNLYKTLLEKDIIFEGRFISQWDYKNIVTTGLRLNDIDWTEGFINQYKSLLHPDARENAYTYNYANLSYFKRDYKTTMRLLQQVEFTNDSYLLSSRSLLLKSYFELNEFDLLESQSEAFMLYLRRSKVLPDYQKQLYKNMVKFIVKLSRCKASGQAVPAKLQQAITTQQDVADITWLRNKLTELE